MRLHPLPLVLTGIVRSALRVCDKTEYHVHGTCRICHGPLSGYDRRSKRFVILDNDEGDYRIEVVLHRAYCRESGRIWTPAEPFYPGTRIGSPAVDLCRALSRTMTCGQVTARLGQMGIKVDRWSVRSYCTLPFPSPPTVAVFGMNIPVSIISLSSLAKSQDSSGSTKGDNVLAACFYSTVQGIPYTPEKSAKKIHPD